MAEITVIVPAGETCEGCDKNVMRAGCYDQFPYCALWEKWLRHNDKGAFKTPECLDGVGTLIESMYIPII